MCNCTCCGGRNLCGPIVPPNDKAKNFRIGLIVITCLHFVLFVVKCVYLGFFSSLTDIAALAIIIIAIIRFDYCQIMVYIVCNLSEVFALIVVLGYYLQTDMGKKTPKHIHDDPEPDSENGAGKKNTDKKSSGGTDNTTNTSKNNEDDHNQRDQHESILPSSKLMFHNGPIKPHAILMFRDWMDMFIQMKYENLGYKNDMYTENEHYAIQKENNESGGDDSAVQLQVTKDKGEESDKLSDKHSSTFIISFCCILIFLYIVFSIIAHFAYREFKGIAEDQAGGSVDGKDGNILHYGIIAKREDDAIEELKENEKLRKERDRINGVNLEDEEGLLPQEDRV